MITRREFLSALAGAAVLGSATSAAALANHKNDGVPQARTKDMLRDGSGGGMPDGHPQNHGEISLKNLGTPVLDGANAGVGAMKNGQGAGMRRGGQAVGTGPNGAMDGTCDRDGVCDGTCDGTDICDGSGPDD